MRQDSAAQVVAQRFFDEGWDATVLLCLLQKLGKMLIQHSVERGLLRVAALVCEAGSAP
jgi:hypothetical protein